MVTNFKRGGAVFSSEDEELPCVRVRIITVPPPQEEAPAVAGRCGGGGTSDLKVLMFDIRQHSNV